MTTSEQIERKIADHPDWRGKCLADIRRFIREADPDMREDCRWRGAPTWSHDGLVCVANIYKDTVKVVFARGAKLSDPRGLFNSELAGNAWRGITLSRGNRLNVSAFKKLVRSAVELNRGGKGAKSRPASTKAASTKAARTSAARQAAGKPVLLAGGNPQIAKADGDAPVQAYLAALPGWKRDVGQRLDALIARAVPGVAKAVRWNSPFSGVPGLGWFLGMHAFTNYLKVTFFRGASLQPPPPGGTGEAARWIDVREDDLDEAQMTAWIRQAAALPGWGKA